MAVSSGLPGREHAVDEPHGVAETAELRLRAKVGDVVQWDVLTIGDDFHTFHVHGHRWLTADGPRDTQVIGPAESYKIRWREDTPGTWLYHCHVESHMMNGMIGIYRVSR